MKRYPIPEAYCRYQITVTGPRPEKLIQEAAPCEFSTQDSISRSRCGLEEAQAKPILAALRAKGTLIRYSQACEPAPAYPELSYKQEHLRSELNACGLSRDAAPGIAGLLDAQFKVLDSLLKALESAARPLLEITISQDGRLADERPWPNVATRSPAIRAKRAQKKAEKIAEIKAEMMARHRQIHPTTERNWERYHSPACDQVETIAVEFATSPGSVQEKKILEALSRIGAPYSETGCGLSDGSARLILSGKPVKEVRQSLLALEGLLSWAVNPRRSNAVADDERVEILTRELAEQKETLSDAPHIRAFILAEIARVKETGGRLGELRKGRLIVVRIKPG